MKKIVFLTALLLSVVFGKSIEQIQSELRERYNEISKKQSETFWQSADAQRLAPHCQNGDKGACRKIIDLQDKYCQNGFASVCGALTESYLQGNEHLGIKFTIDENKAKSYADKVCNLDAVLCASMSGLIWDKNPKLALKYAEKACEMGESMGCFGAWLIYNKGEGGIGKNPQKIKYYSDKLCKAGVKEACE